MSRLMDSENGFFRFMTRVADAVILNILFIITSLPIVTMGASLTAMYYFCLKAVKNEEGYVWKSYWKSFKVNFVQGFIMELIFAVIGIILYIDVKYLYEKAFVVDNFGYKLMFFIVIGFILVTVMTFFYAFPVLARFDNKVWINLRNSMFMSIKHMGTTVPLLFIFAILALLGYFFFPVSVFFVVGTWVYLSSALIVKVIDRYMPKTEESIPEDDYIGDMPEQAEGILNADTIANNVNVNKDNADNDNANNINVNKDNANNINANNDNVNNVVCENDTN